MLLLDRYQHKIKTVEEVAKLVGKRPRKRDVIMCHGVFDVVHPGHLTHLLYAKKHAAILITSITADKFVTKGLYRPHVPERLRALNVAALECVDYVIIDNQETPIHCIRAIQPDYFAKGYEYAKKESPKNSEEINALNSYGGEMMYTPGDIVYSSSDLIDISPPHIKYEKLRLALADRDLDCGMLRKFYNKVFKSKPHVLVVGDLIIDSQTICSAIGGQAKTPTLSTRYEKQTRFVGGAGIVAKHLASAGANVTLATVVGNDDNAQFALDDLYNCNGITVEPVVDSLRPTINKNAIVVDGYRLLKVDTLDNRPISDGHAGLLYNYVKENEYDAVVFSDFRHGIFTKKTINEFIRAIPEGRLSAADSQVASRWGNITDFRGVDLITPNEKEARFSLGDQDSVVRALACDLYQKTQCRYLILKLGSHGGLAHGPNDDLIAIDTFTNDVVDPVGAGDALLAYSVLGMINQTSRTGFAPIAILGMIAAGLECEYDGNVPVTPEEIMCRLDEVDRHLNDF